MPNPPWRYALSVEVHQATGMVAAQAECTVAEALGRLIIRAEAMGQTLDLTALDILDDLVHFRPQEV
jgi:hypothetical protein